MNSIQTESIAAIMEKMGYEMVDTEDADAVVFNTCTVRENANQKIYGHLGHFKEHQAQPPGYENRTVWMYDAGTSRSGKDP